MPRRRWSDNDLRAAVAEHATLAGVMRALGLQPGKYDTIRRHIARLDLDATHIRSVEGSTTRRPRSWTDDDLRMAVAASHSYAGTMRLLGYRPSGGIHRWLKAYISILGIDTSHFTGQGWAKGSRSRRTSARPLEEILIRGSKYPSSTLRQRLIRVGLKPAHCEHCQRSSWRGEPLPLMLDHINGDPTDNRLDNLRILCPNCHALTPTWCARNRKPA